MCVPLLQHLYIKICKECVVFFNKRSGKCGNSRRLFAQHIIMSRRNSKKVKVNICRRNGIASTNIVYFQGLAAQFKDLCQNAHYAFSEEHMAVLRTKGPLWISP